jgi:hypothetical protein
MQLCVKFAQTWYPMANALGVALVTVLVMVVEVTRVWWRPS